MKRLFLWTLCLLYLGFSCIVPVWISVTNNYGTRIGHLANLASLIAHLFCILACIGYSILYVLRELKKSSISD